MTISEQILGIGAEQLDDEDVALQLALAGLQDTVERHLAETGKDAQTLTGAELYQFARKVAPYLDFELERSDGIWKPMPVVTEGEGALLLADEQGEVAGIELLERQERVVGMVKGVLPCLVPTTRWLRENLSRRGSTILNDKAMSAVVVLEGGR